MISRDEAVRLIEGLSRREHSILVSRIMIVLAEHHGVVPNEWELAGLLHDLDYDDTLDDRKNHGILSSMMLKGKVSETVIHAIESHDHRTGVKPQTLLDNSLRFADAVSMVVEKTEEHISQRPWIIDIIENYELPEGLSVEEIIRLVTC